MTILSSLLTPPRNAMDIAGRLLVLTGILHCLTILITFNGGGARLIPVGIIYILLGLGLHRGMRWLAYIAFIIVIIGVLGAYMQIYSVAIPTYVTWLFITLDVLIVLALFVNIWRRQ